MKQYLLILIFLLGVANLMAQTLYVTSGGSVVAQNNAVNIAGNAAVTSGSALVGATVSISSNFVTGQDVLGLNGAASGGISSSYNATSGVLTLSGSASAADYQATLQKVTYTNTSATPATSARVITFSLNAALPFTGNGHYYEYVTSSNISWSSANTAANARTYFGLQGYLATVTSAEENTFVSAKLGGNGCWMGGSDETVEGTWKWMTGPESGNTLTYFNWGASQPDNYNGVEDYLQFFAAGNWNDLPNAASAVEIAGYVVEYGGMTGDPVLHISDNVMVSFTPHVSDLAVSSGTNIKWYDAASGGNLLTATTALIDGNHYYASQTVNSVESTARLDVTANIHFPQGSLTANGPFCLTGAGTLSWAATTGTGPYTIVYNDGTANRTATNVSSGTPFNVNTTPVTSTTTYTLVSVQDANCTRSGGFTGNTATIAVNPQPTPTFTAQPGSTAYTATNVIYTTQSGKSNYVWTFPGTVTTDYIIISGGTSSDNTVTLKYVTTGSKTVTVNYTANGCSAVSATSSTATTVSAALAIGDSFGGGKVAYILISGDPGYIAGETHGLIAAPSDQSTGSSAEWGCSGTTISGADGTSIGTGKQNTIDIMAGCATAGIAARLCGDLVLDGYDDWYLPSKDELYKLCLNKTAIGGFAADTYWSSSEGDTYNAWYYYFPTNYLSNNIKIGAHYVRAIRSF